MDAHEDPALTPAERAASEAVRALPAASADAAFRARLAREFARGEIAPARRVVRGPWFARPALLAPLAAAAALAIVFGFNRGPDWTVIGTEGDGLAIVDQRPIPLRHADELAAALRHGGTVTAPPGGTIDLVAPGVLAVTVTGGCRVELPAAPNRWFARAARAHVSDGDAFFTTGPKFHGAHLDVITPNVDARVVGTSFAVLTDRESGTCVCVMEGRVAVRRLARDTVAMVPAGMRVVTRPDGQMRVERILEYSEHALHRLHAKSAAVLGR